jgi:hypothetical protein
MGNKTTNPDSISWQTPHHLINVSDGLYPVRCSLEMEPPIQDPIIVNPCSKVTVKNGWINLRDAAIAISEAVQEVGGKYDTIVGVLLTQNTIQFIVVWEHISPIGVQDGLVS